MIIKIPFAQKLLIIIITIKILLAESDENVKHSPLRGSLLFEELAFRPITVNPQYYNFYRQFNMTHIQSALEILKEYEKLYIRLCTDIANMPELAPEFYTSSSNDTEYHTNCLISGGLLPEIRAKHEASLLMQFMIDQELSKTPAGIDTMTDTFRYRSDNSKITDAVDIKYCKENCTRTNPYVAHYIYEGTLGITFMKPTNNKIICMKHREIGLSALHYMLRSSCSRDTHEITEMNKLLESEISNFLSPQHRNVFNLNLKDLAINITKNKSKRSAVVSLVPLFLLGGAVTQKSPLDALGSLGASILGLGSKQDVIITKQKLDEHASQISNLAVNQELITKAIQDIQDHIKSISLFNSFTTHKIAQTYAELDNKGLIRHLQNLIQLTLLKMQSAINSATQAMPSPYVFSNKDLQNITQTFRMNEIMLTTNLNEISASILLVDNQLTFMFNVPIKDERNKFRFYEIRQLPFFLNGISYKVDHENTFIGINDYTNEYILMSQTEFQRCLILPICILPTPFIQITERSPCEILTFKDNIPTCPIIEIPHATPKFYTYKNTTIYSLPKSIQIHISCKQGRQAQSTFKVINGMGTFQTKPGCTIHIPPDTNIRPEYMIGQEYLKGTPILGAIQEFSKDSAFLPLLFNVSTTTIKPLKISQISNFQQGVDLIFNHEQSSTQVVRILTYTAIAILFLYSLTCCFPKLRIWLKSFCLITKPEKYWSMRNYTVTSPFIKTYKVNEPQSQTEAEKSTFNQRLAKIFKNKPPRPPPPKVQNTTHEIVIDAEINPIPYRSPPKYNARK